MRPSRFPRNKVIAVDVDGTLYSQGVLNQTLADWCELKSKEGYFMILWSARGAEYAAKAADAAGLTDLFDCIIGKPRYLVDDRGWSWVKFTKIVRLPEVVDDLKFADKLAKKERDK